MSENFSEERAGIVYPTDLNEVDIQLINKQCENQEATSKKQIEGFALAYKKSKDLVLNHALDQMTGEDIESLILELATLIETQNQKGYRLVPVSFFGGGTAIPPGQIPQAMETFCSVYATQQIEPEDAYLEFERIHPFVDGNGRTGDLLWKISMTRKSGVWPESLPPDVFNQEK